MSKLGAHTVQPAPPRPFAASGNARPMRRGAPGGSARPLRRAVLALLAACAAPARADYSVALFGEPPDDHRHSWVEQWLGEYLLAPLKVNGHPTFVKADDPLKVMWLGTSNHWHCGRKQDIQYYTLFEYQDNAKVALSGRVFVNTAPVNIEFRC